MKTLFSVAAGLTMLLGIGWLCFPQFMLSLWSVQTDGTGLYLARRYGGLLFGYTTLLWLARAAPPSPGRAAVVAGGAVVTSVMTLLSLLGVMTGIVGAGAWSAVAIEAALAAAFIYYCVTGR